MPHLYEPYRPFIQTYFEIIECRGRIAVTLGWYIDNEEPQEIRDIYLSNLSAELYPDWIGQHHTSIDHNTIYFYPGRRWAAETDLMIRVQEARPIPKPRAGKSRSTGYRYNWIWTPNFQNMGSGRWVMYDWKESE